MRPDLHTCVRCKQQLKAADTVMPVMQVVNPRAVNPNDPTDVGLALGDRIHFVHVNCADTTLASTSVLLAS